MIRNMARTLSAALLTLALLPLSACTSSPSSSTAPASPGTTTTRATPSSTTSAKPNKALALAVPGRAPGEVSRVVFSGAKDAKDQGMTYVSGTPAKGAYEVRAACTAKAVGTTLTYLLVDARPPKAGTPPVRRPLSTGQIICDGRVHAKETPKLASPIQLSFVGADRVSKAYAVLVPRR
jgi:hypothetical protein